MIEQYIKKFIFNELTYIDMKNIANINHVAFWI